MAKTNLASTAFAVALMVTAPALAADPPPAGNGTPAPAPAAIETAKSEPAAADKKAPPADAATSAPVASTPATPETPAWETALATRRGGFTVGLSLGASLGNITGYPNDIRKNGRPEYLTDMGAAFGGGGTLWLGGALADWLVFGVGVGFNRSQGGGAITLALTFVFHTELFPLFTLGGVWRELGISFDTGAGSVTGEAENKPAGEAGKLVGPLIESGAASRVGAGGFACSIKFMFW